MSFFCGVFLEQDVQIRQCFCMVTFHICFNSEMTDSVWSQLTLQSYLNVGVRRVSARGSHFYLMIRIFGNR